MKLTKKTELILGYIAILYAVYLFFILVNNYFGRTEEHWRFFYAFTQQSNMIAMVWLLGFGIDVFLPSNFRNIVRNKIVMTAVMVYMSVTFFIVMFILNPILQGLWLPFESANEFFLHNMTTIMIWIYFFIIPGFGENSIKKLALVLLYPICYFAANLYIGANFNYLDGTPAYAYNFVNPANYTNAFAFFRFIGMLIIIFYIFGLIFMQFKQQVSDIDTSEEYV